MIDTTTPASFKSGETVSDTAYSKDGAGAWTTLAIIDTVAEIASTGVYEIDLTAAEMNHDQVMIKMTSAAGADTAFLFDMRSELASDNYTRLGAPAGASISADIADVPTVSEFNARTLASADYFDWTTDTVANVSTVATLSGHTAQTGDSFARIGLAGAGLTNIDLPNQTMDITGNLSGSVGSVTGAVGSVTAAVTIDASSVDAIWDETKTSHVTADSFGVALKDVLVDTDDLQTNQGNWLTATGFATSVALATAQLDLDTITGTDGVTLATAQALYAPAKAGDNMGLTATATSAQLVDDVWDEDLSPAHDTAGSAGKALQDAGAAGDPWATALPGAYGAGTAGNILGNNLDAAITDRTLVAASYFDPAADTVATVTSVTNAVTLPTMPTDWITAAGLSAGAGDEIADQVWDELIAGHLGVGSTGEALNAAGSAGDPWVTALPGAYSAGQAGFILGTNLNATVSSRMATTHIDATGGAVDNVTLVATTTTNTDMRGTNNALLAASAPTNFGDLAITLTTGLVSVGTNNDKTGYSISGAITTLDGLNNVAATDIVSAGAITTLAGAVVNVDLVDTITTYTGNVPQTADNDTKLTSILDDTANQIPGSLLTIDGNVDSILVDTGTTIPATLTDMAGSTFDTSTDSLEAIRNRGDVAWLTGAGGGGAGGNAAADVIRAIVIDESAIMATVTD